MERNRPWPPFCRPGLCGLRGSLSVLTLVVLVAYILCCEAQQMKQDHTRLKRGISSRLLSHVSSLRNNLWYQYANYSAHAQNLTNCYVCTYIPLSASINVRPVPLDHDTTRPCWGQNFTMCNQTGHAGNLKLPAGLHHFVNMSKEELSVLGQCKKTLAKDPSEFIGLQLNNTLFTTVHMPEKLIFPHCYMRQGTRKVGMIPQKHCLETVSVCRPFNNSDKEVHLNFSMAASIDGQNSTCTTGSFVPGENGTTVLPDIYWLCGNKVHTNLPQGWHGVCALVRLAERSFIVHASKEKDTTPLTLARSKQSVSSVSNDQFEAHDSIWGTDVPDELWSDGKKVALTLFPWTGEGELILRVETVNYRVLTFMNTTTSALQGGKVEEIGEMFLFMQNGLIIDLLTAAEVGVCAEVGKACCTFIPEHDEDGGKFDQALANLAALQEAITEDSVVEQLWPWLLLVAGHLGPFLLVITVLTCCMLPLLRRRLAKMISDVMYAKFPDRDNYQPKYQQLLTSSDP